MKSTTYPLFIMLKSFLLVSALMVISTYTVQAQDEGLVPDQTEYLALKDLYTSTTGDSWHNTTNWPAASWPATATNAEFATWFGVVVENGDVVTIAMNNNQLHGSLPSSLANLSELRWLTVGGNELQGTFPDVIFSLSKLTLIDIAYNQFTGSIPSFSSAQFNADYLSMGSSGFTGPFPDLSSQTNLYQLNLSYTNFTTGPLPNSMNSLVNMSQLYLANTNRNGRIPDFIGTKMLSMTHLMLTGNQFSGNIPPSLGNLIQLIELYLDYNQLEGPIPPGFGALHNLYYLVLSGNKLTSIPEEMGDMQALQQLIADHNEITSIPEELGNAPSLFNINLMNNKLTSLPDLSAMNLGALQLSNNKLSGTLPAWIAAKTSLSTLRIANNQFSGSLPAGFSSLVNMYELTLDHNQFTGTFPDISNWNSLFGLQISYNQFTGDFPDVPSSIGVIDITGNHFISLPTSIFSVNNNYYSLLYYNDIKEIRNLQSDITNGNIHPKNSGWFTVDHNQLDFSQLLLLKQIPSAYIVDLPQNEIKDITKETFTEGEELIIPSRPLSGTSSIVWEFRKNSLAAWSDVTSRSEDPVKQTFKRSAATATDDEGEYRWRITDSQYTESWQYIQSVPIVVKEAKTNILDNYAFQYKYDGRKRMTHKKVPGADWVYMVYDKRDRLVMTQDGEQRKKYQWSYTQYDALNRPVITGMYTHIYEVTQQDMTTYIESGGAYEEYNGDASTHGYTNSTWNSNYFYMSQFRPLTVTYYDTYDYRTMWGNDFQYHIDGLSQLVASQNMTYTQPSDGEENTQVIGQVVGVKVKQFQEFEQAETWLRSATYYDDKYRVVQVVADNAQGGLDRTSNVLDFFGKVLKTKASHTTDEIKWSDIGVAAATANSVASHYAGSSLKSKLILAANTDGWIEFKAEQLDVPLVVVGLLPEDETEGYNFIVQQQGARIEENGVTVASYYPRKSYYILRVARQGSTVTFYVNNELFYISPRSSTSALKLSIYIDAYSGIQDIKTSFASVSSTHSTERTFTYDHAGRLLTTHHSIDGATPILLAKNEYNELGQLIDKNLHSTDGTTFKQSTDYRYNIRGWLTSINNAALTTGAGTNNEDDSNVGRDLFGMELAYEKPITGLTTNSDVQYNGNISAITYSNNLSLGSVKSNGYKFGYDAMNRLTESNFREKNAIGWNVSQYLNGSNVLQNKEAFSETGFEYDLNGNIKKLNRSGQSSSAAPGMDELDYTYDGNQLLAVKDDGDVAKGFVDGNVTGDDYTYDANGNMISDANKGIIAITYNHLNLPSKVYKNTAEYITYSYDATGRKLSQSVFNAAGELKKKSDYAGEYFYENDTLKFINHEEGRVVLDRKFGDPELVASYDGSDPSGFFIYANLHGTLSSEQQGGETYLKFTNADYRWAGPMSNAIAVEAGETYKFRIKGYTTRDYAYPYVMGGDGSDVVWYQPFPLGAANEAWVESTFVIPTGMTSVHVGALFDYMPDLQDAFYMNAIELYKITNPAPQITNEYQYHLKDHLGNVRTTFTTKEEIEETIATLEPQYENTERSQYLKYDDTRRVLDILFDHTNGVKPSVTPGYSLRLNGSPNERNGIARSISVMPGDKIDMQVFGKYIDPNTPHPDQTAWNNLLAFAADVATAAQQIVIDGVGYTSGTLRLPPYSGVLTDPNESVSFPKAHLNWAIFDRNDKFLDGGAKQLQGGAEDGTDVLFGEINASIDISEPGYVYIWLSNTSTQVMDVYFDDFSVKHTKSPVVQQEEYYPFGLTFNSYQREKSVLNKWKFQGQEHIYDLGLNWDSFKWRNHQPDIGRFFNVDPLAEKFYYNSPYAFSENKVTSHVELEGLEAVNAGVLLKQEANKAANAVMNTVNSVGNAISNVPSAISNGVREAIEFIDQAEKNLPHESTSKNRSSLTGMQLDVFSTGGYGQDHKYVRKADPLGEMYAIDIDVVSSMGLGGRDLKRSSISDFFEERVPAVAEGTSNLAQGADAVNKLINSSSSTLDSSTSVRADTTDPRGHYIETKTSVKTGQPTSKQKEGNVMDLFKNNQ